MLAILAALGAETDGQKLTGVNMRWRWEADRYALSARVHQTVTDNRAAVDAVAVTLEVRF